MSENETIEERANEIIKTEEKVPLHKKIWNGIIAIPKTINRFAHKHPWITAGTAAVVSSAATVGTAVVVNKVIEKQNGESEEIVDELREDGSNVNDESTSIVNNVDDVNVNNVDV